MTSKPFLFINSLLAVLLLLVLAKIGADVAGYRLAKLFPLQQTAAAGSASPAAPSEDLLSFSPLLAKGLFGPATRGTLTPVAPATSREAAAPAAAPSDFTLLGTSRGSFRETFALVKKNSTGEERVFRLGDQLFSAGALLSVSKEYIEILSGKERVKLTMPLAAGTDSAKPAPSVATPSAVPPLVSGTPGNMTIDQRALTAALDNIGQAMTDARLLPSMKEGKVEGFKASEVKPQGVFGMIGIQNGDVLQRINDFPIDSPEKAMQSFMTLKGQNRIKLDLIRNGRPATFNYDIR